MILIAPKNRADMVQAHDRAARKNTQTRSTAPRKPHNIETVLDLGNVVFFHFRGRAYGIPPLPWERGQRLLSAYLETRTHLVITAKSQPAYHRALRQIVRLLWRSCYPASRGLRMLRACGLLQNPFKYATEKELADLSSFFLARRMRSGDSMPAVVMPTLSEVTH